jgi:tellurite resistance protein TehA-like permease
MSGVEPEVQDFLKKIVWSVFLGLLWLMLNMTMGIYFGLLFIEDGISLGNIIFYLFLLSSLAALIWFYYKTWKKKFPHG